MFITVGILSSLSRGGLIIFFVTTFLNLGTLWKRKNYLFLLLILIIAFLLVCIVNNLSLATFGNYNIERLFFFGQENQEDFSNGRLATALTGLMIYTRHPLVGAGFGNILDYANMLSHFKLYTHNMYIEILAVSGPLPLLCYLFMLVFLWYSTFRTKADGLKAAVTIRHFMIALAIMGGFSHYLLYMKPIWILLALCPVVCRLNRGEEDAFGDNHLKV
ncbi:MAG: O-antigen ligase family protein [Desulfitobacteriaceae bacterium]|nr:O-antigen ligase family protein [Desulfitobacteriaceae bacterium]